MATELKMAAVRPLIIAAAIFTFVAGAAFAWAAIENQSVSANTGEQKVVALPN